MSPVHRDIIIDKANEMQLYRLVYNSQSALHVSGDVLRPSSEAPTVFTASGNVHQCRYRPMSWISWN